MMNLGSNPLGVELVLEFRPPYAGPDSIVYLNGEIMDIPEYMKCPIYDSVRSSRGI